MPRWSWSQIFNFLALIIATQFLVNSAQSLDDQNDYKHCDSPQCILKTSKITEWMNPEFNPCTNLEEFACGRFFNGTVHNDRYRVISRKIIARDKFMEQKRRVLAGDVMGDDIAPFRLAKRFFSICTYTGENTMK
jgi:hypothetical protein